MHAIIAIHQYHCRAFRSDPGESLLSDLCGCRSFGSQYPGYIQLGSQKLLNGFARQAVKTDPELELPVGLLTKGATPIAKIRFNARVNRGVNG
jgi:hypothetical protein